MALLTAEPRVKPGVGAGSGSLPHVPPIEACDREYFAMSEVIFFETGVAHQGTRIAATAPRSTPGERVFVREAPSGIWFVHDETDRKGGCFRDRASAFKFVEDEFGERAEMIVQPLFTRLATRVEARARESCSVAQRAIMAG